MRNILKIASGALAWGVIGVSAALAQTSTTSTTTIPGVPNTGVGGDAVTNILLLGISAAIVIVGLVYLARMRVREAE